VALPPEPARPPLDVTWPSEEPPVLGAGEDSAFPQPRMESPQQTTAKRVKVGKDLPF
jgi:hypothetical protein